MSRVFVKGDCHGDFTKIIDFIDRFELDEDDIIIVLGDMGLYWRKDKKDAEAWLREYESRERKCQIWFIDGNHENFDLLEKLPAIPNTCRKYCSEHISYIPRGAEIYINNLRCLFIGGADSVDKWRRTPHLSWWPQEQITEQDILNISAGHYDYVFSHCCPRSIFEDNKICLTAPFVDQSKVDHTSEDMLELLKNRITFEHWYFAHYHADKQLDEHFRILLNDFVEIK